MLNYQEQQKIKGFVADEILFNAVKNVLVATFLKNKGNTDVQTLAAERIAINLLEEAVKELEKFKIQDRIEEKEKNNIAL